MTDLSEMQASSAPGSDRRNVRLIGIAVAVAALVQMASAATLPPVTLAWNQNPESDIAGYDLSYGTESGNYGNKISAGLNTSVSVPGLSEGVTYYFVVVAYNTAGLRSLPSAEISYKRTNQAPESTIASPSSNTSITAGETVSFSGSGSDPDGDTSLSYLWDFGSGSGIANSAAQNPGSLRFNIPGAYVVTLTVTDSKGLADPSPAERTVTVSTAESGHVITHLDEPATPPTTSPMPATAYGTSKYAGFLTSAEGGRVLGYFKSINVSKTGALSAKMYFGNTSYSIKGVFDQGGYYYGVATPKLGPPATVELQLVITPAGGYKIDGSVNVLDQAANVSAVKSGATGLRAGVYTVLVPNSEEETLAPQGHGYGLMTVTSTGTAKIKGLLGDGTKWTAKCYITPDGEMPLYAALYRKAGSVGGMVRFRDVPGVSDCDGEVSWIKPGGTGIQPYSQGFDLQRNLIGSRFSPAGLRLISAMTDTVPNAQASAGAGSGVTAKSWDLEWTLANKILYAGPEKLKVKTSTKSGQLKGAVSDGLKWKAGGVVFQKQAIAAGLLYANGEQSRSLVIVPKE